MNKKFFIDTDGRKHKFWEKDKLFWRVSGYVVVLSVDKKILMIKSGRSGLWELPGGGIDVGETIFQGIEREALEETGFKIQITSPLPLYIGEDWFYYKMGKNKFTHSFRLVFKAKTRGRQDKSKIDKTEIKQVAFKKLKDLNKNNCHAISLPVINLLK